MGSTKILSSTTVFLSALRIIINVYLAANQHITMISGESYDTVDWSKFSLHHRNKLFSNIFKPYLSIFQFLLYILSNKCCLVSRRDFFHKHSKIFPPPNFWQWIQGNYLEQIGAFYHISADCMKAVSQPSHIVFGSCWAIGNISGVALTQKVTVVMICAFILYVFAFYYSCPHDTNKQINNHLFFFIKTVKSY